MSKIRRRIGGAAAPKTRQVTVFSADSAGDDAISA
jgi:hypothetical protein